MTHTKADLGRVGFVPTACFPCSSTVQMIYLDNREPQQLYPLQRKGNFLEVHAAPLTRAPHPGSCTNRVVKEAENRDYEIASMNDESQFGPEFHIIEMVGAVFPPGPLPSLPGSWGSVSWPSSLARKTRIRTRIHNFPVPLPFTSKARQGSHPAAILLHRHCCSSSWR